ncbi:hypothetical protein TB2_002821 [Malus domestica]
MASLLRRGGSDQPPQQPLQRRITRTQTAGNLGETAFDSEIMPSSLVEIALILRVANEVETNNPRVAYLSLNSHVHGGPNRRLSGARVPEEKRVFRGRIGSQRGYD